MGKHQSQREKIGRYEVVEKLSADQEDDAHVQVKEQKRDKPSSDSYQRRKPFWTHFLERYPTYRSEGPADGKSNRWRKVKGWDVNISYYIAKDGVAIFYRGLRGVDDEVIHEIVKPHVDWLESKLDIAYNPAAGGHLFHDKLTLDPESKGNWDQLSDWLDDKITIYELALLELKIEDVKNSPTRSVLPSNKIVLPQPFGWIEIPGEGYSIGKYPVTNDQYKLFIDADGYREKKWWTNEGWQVREEGWEYNFKIYKMQKTAKPWIAPSFWTYKKWNGAEHPVVGVSWFEAVALLPLVKRSRGGQKDYAADRGAVAVCSSGE